MIFELSLMTVSAAVMIFLLIHKQRELVSGGKTSISVVREKADPLLRDIHQSTGKVLSGVTLHNFILFSNHLFVMVVRLFMHVSHRVHKTSSSIVEKASKKREDLTRSGAASFYLKQIKETKENMGEVPETGTDGEKM
jgi:hypothetical protein